MGPAREGWSSQVRSTVRVFSLFILDAFFTTCPTSSSVCSEINYFRRNVHFSLHAEELVGQTAAAPGQCGSVAAHPSVDY